MIKYLAVLLLVASEAKSDVAALANWQLGSLDELSLDVEKFSCYRNPMTPDIPCKDYKGRVQLNFTVGILNDFIKWENHVHGEGTDSKFVTMGWEYYASVPTPWGIEPYIHHHSIHTLDQGQPTIVGKTKAEKFPVEDSIGIRFTFFKRGK